MQTHRLQQDLRPGIQHHLLNSRHGLSDLARYSVDLTWARTESERASRLKAYPSPPMSGSPPPPPKPYHEAGDRSQGSYHASHDAYHRAPSTTPPHGADMRLPSMMHGSQPYSQQHHQPLQPPHATLGNLSRHYPSEPADRLPYPSYGRPEEQHMPPSMNPMGSYPPPSHMQQGPPMPGYAPYLPPLHGPSSMQQGYPVSPHAVVPAQIPSPVPGPSGGMEAAPPYGSPKTQRKTKGHVAAACVPCKRAHLRCDAQRPCSRCHSNGKEDACIDVQHKKRGRPRLREERDLRYEHSGRESSGGHSAEPSIRRPVPTLYGQPSVSIGSGYIERGSVSDANAYPAPLSISTRALEPMVFLTMDLELAKASHSFLDATGRQSVKGLSLLDMISPMERERVIALQRQMQDERQRKDPQYLPPIFAKRDEERVIQSLGMSSDDLARYSLAWQEYLTFSSADGLQRAFPVRFGLAKQDSIYFIVMLLHVAVRPLGHPTPSPHSRDMPYAYQQMHHQQQQQQQQNQMYSHPTPVSATFDMNRPRLPSDSAGLPHRPTPPGGPSPMVSGMSPGVSSSYGPSPGHSDYSAPAAPHPYQTPRSELFSGPLPHRQPQQAGGSGYQLPPIRSRQGSRPMDGFPDTKDDKSRVDIGGLIDQSDAPNRMP